MKTRPNYKYKIFNAQVCVRCEAVEVAKCRIGFRGMVCGKCADYLKVQFAEWDKTGIYLGRQDNGAIIIKGRK